MRRDRNSFMTDFEMDHCAYSSNRLSLAYALTKLD